MSGTDFAGRRCARPTDKASIRSLVTRVCSTRNLGSAHPIRSRRLTAIDVDHAGQWPCSGIEFGERRKLCLPEPRRKQNQVLADARGTSLLGFRTSSLVRSPDSKRSSGNACMRRRMRCRPPRATVSLARPSALLVSREFVDSARIGAPRIHSAA